MTTDETIFTHRYWILDIGYWLIGWLDWTTDVWTIGLEIGLGKKMPTEVGT